MDSLDVVPVMAPVVPVVVLAATRDRSGRRRDAAGQRDGDPGHEHDVKTAGQPDRRTHTSLIGTREGVCSALTQESERTSNPQHRTSVQAEAQILW